MTGNERLFSILGDVDLTLVASAAPGAGKRQPAAWRKWLPTAACFALAALIGVAAWRMNDVDPVVDDDRNDYPFYTMQVTATDTEIVADTSTSQELAVVPRWEEMTVSEQFGEFYAGEARFSSRVTPIDAAHVGEQLGEATARGYDIYTDTTYERALTYHAIRGISTDCALAVRFAQEDGYYVYVNSWYRPETLEELITALNLRENMTFGDFHADGFNEDGNWEKVRFLDPDDSIVWEQLLCDTSLENVYDEVGWYGSILSICVNIPLLGYENIALWLTEDGHLVTNILDTGKAFFLGEERVRDFLLYVVLHCPDIEVTVIDYGNDVVTTDEVDGAVESPYDPNGIAVATTEMTTQNRPAYNPDVPQTSVAQTTAAPPYTPARTPDGGTVTSGAYNPMIITSEE